MEKFEIKNTQNSDLGLIYHLFDEAIAYQKRNNFPVWNGYDKKVLQQDIAQNLQFKIVNDSEDILCIFSICFEDAIIWRDMEEGNSLYLHRIVVNPQFKGKKLFGQILQWATDYAKNNNLSSIRMDTWGNNPNIIQYYTDFGFTFIENYTTPDSSNLPVQHRNLYLALLEYKI